MTLHIKNDVSNSLLLTNSKQSYIDITLIFLEILSEGQSDPSPREKIPSKRTALLGLRYCKKMLIYSANSI